MAKWMMVVAMAALAGCAMERSPVRTDVDASDVDGGAEPDARAHVLDCSQCVAYCEAGSAVPACVGSGRFGCALGCQPVCGSCDPSHQQIVCPPGSYSLACD